MDIAIQWDNSAHFLLDRAFNKNGISIDLFGVKADKAAVRVDPKHDYEARMTSFAQSGNYEALGSYG